MAKYVVSFLERGKKVKPRKGMGKGKSLEINLNASRFRPLLTREREKSQQYPTTVHKETHAGVPDGHLKQAAPFEN